MTDPQDIYTRTEFDMLESGKTINHSVVIRNGNVSTLNPIEVINGTLGLSDCIVETLSPLKIVSGDIWCSFHDRKPLLRTLGSLQRVGGDAHFQYVPIEDLGDLEHVEGDLSLRDTQIESMGKLAYVGGNLSLPMRLKGNVDLSSIYIGGTIRYWQDRKPPYADNGSGENVLQKSPIPVPYWPHAYIYPNHNISEEPNAVREFYNFFKTKYSEGIILDTEGSSNYQFMLIFDLDKQISDPILLASKYEPLYTAFPVLKRWCLDILLERYRKNNMPEKAWQIAKCSEYLSLSTIYSYANVLGDDIFDGEIAAKLCGTGCLTPFGKTHVKDVLSFFRKSLLTFEKEKNCRFYNLFFDEGKSYKSVKGTYSSDYYRQFYILDEDSFMMYEAIDKDNLRRGKTDRRLVIEHAITEQLRALLIDAEDLFRESIGVAKIGEGWVNETALFYKLKHYFSEYRVVQHGHPKWLGKQHLDIYFVDLNIGVEYQGLQHYKPVDYFGGKEGFIRSQERDERKRMLCQDNSCPLIYVNEGYVFDDVVSSIQEAISSTK